MTIYYKDMLRGISQTSEDMNPYIIITATNCELVWPSGKALNCEAEGLRFDSASDLISLQKCCGLWTPSCDFVPHC